MECFVLNKFMMSKFIIRKRYHRVRLAETELHDIVIDKEILKAKQSCNQLIQALRNAELEELLQKQAAKK